MRQWYECGSRRDEGVVSGDKGLRTIPASIDSMEPREAFMIPGNG
jgi:hypothetical protein